MEKINEIANMVKVTNDQKIALRLALPNEKPAGLAVLLHGFSSSMKNSTNEALLPLLTAKDIAVLRFDFRGHGGESDGLIDDATLSSAVLDLKTAVSWATSEYSSLSYIRRVLVASSFGAAAALAGAKIVGASGIVLKSPVSDIYNMQLQRRGEKGMHEWKETGYATVTGKKGTIRLKYAYVEDAMRYNLPQLAKEYGIPISVIHGSEDEVVPYKHSVRLCQTVGTLSTFITIEGGDHRYSRQEDFDKAINFLVEQTQLFLGLK